jgi:hypothetical protein
MRRVSPVVSSGVVLLACTALLLPHCASPTALTIAVYSDISCDKRPIAGLAVGSSMDEVRGKAFSSTSLGCAPDGKMGSVVVYPSAGAKNGRVAVQVVTRVDGEDPATCSPANAYKGCIVAKRELRLVPNQDLQMRIDLRKSCEGIPCDEASTCVRGACVTAIVGCNGVCTEAEIPGAPALVPRAIPDDAAAAADASVDSAATDGAPRDSAVANTPFCNGWTYCDDFEGGGNIPWQFSRVGIATMQIENGIANSGISALRNRRPTAGPTQASLSFSLQYSPANAPYLTCEYDVYWAGAALGLGQDYTLSRFNVLGLPNGYTEFQSAVFGSDNGSAYARWRTVLNGTPAGSRLAAGGRLQSAVWYTVTTKIVASGGAVSSLNVAYNSSSGNGSAASMTPSLRYGSIVFDLGVLELGNTAVTDVYYDNVRCR